MDNDRILRFSLTERISHWVHVASFFALILTGLVVLSPKFHFISYLFGGVQEARVVHRIAAVVFSIGTMMIFFLGDRRALASWLRDIFTWSRDDVGFLKGFPKEFFGGHADIPEQGRFNGGEKLNSLIILGNGALLVISGLMMWFASYIPLDIVRWAYPLHDVGAFLMVAVVIGHIYVGAFLPSSKESLNGIVRGTVARAFAQAHHPKWYREVMRKGNPK